MATKKSPIMPSPFGAKPVFGNTAADAAVVKRAPAPVENDEAEEQKHFTVPVYPYSLRAVGASPWEGTLNVVVKAEAFQAPKGFDQLATSPVEGGIETVQRVIRAAVTTAGCLKYVRKAVLPAIYSIETPRGPERVDVKLGVYVDAKTKRALLLDQAFGPAPRSVFGPKTGDIVAVTNAAAPSEVLYVAACFRDGANRPLHAAKNLVVRGLVDEAIALMHIACVAEPQMVDPSRDKKHLAALESLSQSLLDPHRKEALRLFPSALGSKKAPEFLQKVVEAAAQL